MQFIPIANPDTNPNPTPNSKPHTVRTTAPS